MLNYACTFKYTLRFKHSVHNDAIVLNKLTAPIYSNQKFTRNIRFELNNTGYI